MSEMTIDSKLLDVSICNGLAAIFNGKFQAISGRISEIVRDSSWSLYV